MKTFITGLVPLLFFGVFLGGCGTELPSALTSRQFAPAPVRCEIPILKHNLCAAIAWEVGPVAGGVSSFTVQFTDASTGAAVVPPGQFASFARMTCCGSLAFSKAEDLGNGKFRVSDYKFRPGQWDVFLQIKVGDDVQRASTRIRL